MEDWYNDSLPRYPRVLIQREQRPLTHQINRNSDVTAGGNVVRIRVQGHRSGSQDLDQPTVTVRRYNNDKSIGQPKVTVEAVRSGTGIPIQIRHLTTGPVTNIACAQPHSAYARRRDPMKAVPLASVSYDLNANPLDLKRPLSGGDLNTTRFIPQQFRSPLTDNVFDSFEKQFDRFTSEYTSPAAVNKAYNRSQSQRIEDPRSYASCRHESEDVSTSRQRHSSLTSSNITDRYKLRGERAASPSVYVSTYSRTTFSTPRQSPIKSPTAPDDRKSVPRTGQPRHSTSSDSQTDQNDRHDNMSVARAKWVLDKVLKDLVSKDGLKGQQWNCIISEAKDTIKKFSDELSSSKGCQGDDTDSGYSGSGDTTQSGFTWTTIDVKEQIRKYNDAHQESKLTKVAGDEETFQGDIQICICLEHPVSMLLNTRPKSIFESFGSTSDEEERITASATIPNNTITKLHITSEDTTDVVIQQLLNKFNIIDSPRAYGLYEQTLDKQSNKEKLRKSAHSERPLLNFLRWNTETQDQKRFLLKESYNADILWDSFSIPELSNFILMLELEYKNQLELITNKYSAYRHNVQSRMKELRPGGTSPCS